LLSAFKNAPYTTIIDASFLMMLGFFISFFYLSTYAVTHGMNDELASYLVSILNGASFFSRIVLGILADRLGRLNMLCAAGLSNGIFVLCWQRITTSASITVFAALYGFFSGAVLSLTLLSSASTPNDPGNIGTYMGMEMFIVSLAALIGLPFNGALISNYGGFYQVSIFSGVFVLADAFFRLLAKHVTGKGIFGKI
jgi:MFS family permease